MHIAHAFVRWGPVVGRFATDDGRRALDHGSYIIRQPELQNFPLVALIQEKHVMIFRARRRCNAYLMGDRFLKDLGCKGYIVVAYVMSTSRLHIAATITIALELEILGNRPHDTVSYRDIC